MNEKLAVFLDSNSIVTNVIVIDLEVIEGAVPVLPNLHPAIGDLYDPLTQTFTKV
jgi:hypothetical protein